MFKHDFLKVFQILFLYTLLLQGGCGRGRAALSCCPVYLLARAMCVAPLNIVWLWMTGSLQISSMRSEVSGVSQRQARNLRGVTSPRLSR